jgi:hypothetical protein
MAKVRLNIEVNQELADVLDSLAETEHATRSDIVRRALSVLKAFKQQREIGRPHLGFARDPQNLDAEILGILNSAVPATCEAASSSASLARASLAQPSRPAAASTPDPAFSVPLAPVSRLESPRPTPTSDSRPVSIEAVMTRWSPHSVSY